MPPLYITQQGAKLRIQERRLVVERDGERLLNVPIGHVSSIMLFGNISLTTPAISLLLENKLEVVFLSVDGNYKGRLRSESPNARKGGASRRTACWGSLAKPNCRRWRSHRPPMPGRVLRQRE